MSKIRDEIDSMQVDINDMADQIKWALDELVKMSKRLGNLSEAVDEALEDSAQLVSEQHEQIKALESELAELQ